MTLSIEAFNPEKMSKYLLKHGDLENIIILINNAWGLLPLDLSLNNYRFPSGLTGIFRLGYLDP